MSILPDKQADLQVNISLLLKETVITALYEILVRAEAPVLPLTAPADQAVQKVQPVAGLLTHHRQATAAAVAGEVVAVQVRLPQAVAEADLQEPEADSYFLRFSI